MGAGAGSGDLDLETNFLQRTAQRGQHVRNCTRLAMVTTQNFSLFDGTPSWLP